MNECGDNKGGIKSFRFEPTITIGPDINKTKREEAYNALIGNMKNAHLHLMTADGTFCATCGNVPVNECKLARP